MRILVDTNVLFSALLFPKSVPSMALRHVIENHDLFLCQQNLDELRTIIIKKAPKLIVHLDDFFSALPFTKIPNSFYSSTKIRDETDQPIIDAAISASIDIVITGDNDFLSLKLEKPECITPREYLDRFAL